MNTNTNALQANKGTFSNAREVHTKSIATTKPYQIVKPITDTQTILNSFNEYQTLKSQLLQPNDYQQIQGKNYIKKSGFRKLATAFGISIEISKEQRVNFNDYFIYEITAKAIAPNSRFTTACASCASNERKFSHVENDVRAIAQTRAVNRCISDLIGGGEVSAEEMAGTVKYQANSNSSTSSVSITQDAQPEYQTTDINKYSNTRTNIVNKSATSQSSHTSPSSFTPLTSAQRNLLIKLIERKTSNEEERSSMFSKVKQMSKFDASKAITSMLQSS